MFIKQAATRSHTDVNMCEQTCMFVHTHMHTCITWVKLGENGRVSLILPQDNTECQLS